MRGCNCYLAWFPFYKVVVCGCILTNLLVVGLLCPLVEFTMQ